MEFIVTTGQQQSDGPEEEPAEEEYLIVPIVTVPPSIDDIQGQVAISIASTEKLCIEDKVMEIDEELTVEAADEIKELIVETADEIEELKSWFCEVCKRDIPHDELERHFIYHPIFMYPSMRENQVLPVVEYEDSYNEIAGLLGKILGKLRRVTLDEPVLEEQLVISSEMDNDDMVECGTTEIGNDDGIPMEVTENGEDSHSVAGSLSSVETIKPVLKSMESLSSELKLNKASIKLHPTARKSTGHIRSKKSHHHKSTPKVISTPQASSPSRVIAKEKKIDGVSDVIRRDHSPKSSDTRKVSSKVDDGKESEVVVKKKKKKILTSPLVAGVSEKIRKDHSSKSSDTRKFSSKVDDGKNEVIVKKKKKKILASPLVAGVSEKTRNDDSPKSSDKRKFSSKIDDGKSEVSVKKKKILASSLIAGDVTKNEDSPKPSGFVMNTQNPHKSAKIKDEIEWMLRKMKKLKMRVIREKDFDKLNESMEASFLYRKYEIQVAYLSIGDTLSTFPAMSDYRILKREFERLRNVNLRTLEKKLKNGLVVEYERFKMKHYVAPVEIIAKGIADLQKSEDPDLRRDVQILCFGFQITQGKFCSKFFKLRNSEVERPFMGVTPSIDVLGDLSSDSKKITVYCEEQKICLVPNFYEAIMIAYGLYWIFNLQYEKGAQPLFERFDELIGE